MSYITIANTQINKRPASIKVGRFDLTKSNRTASGKMVIEVIRAEVRRIDVAWRFMPDSELQNLLGVLATNKPFFELTYPDVGGEQTMIAYVGDINTSLWHTINGVRYWDEVSTSFIEQ